MFLSLVAAIPYPTSINLQYNLVNIICGLSMFYPKYLVTRVSKNCVNEEKVTVAGCSTGSKEFLRQKVHKNVANKKHRNTLRINNNKYT